MDKKTKFTALLKFYECKLENKYYDNEKEKIFLEERIKHFKNVLIDA